MKCVLDLRLSLWIIGMSICMTMSKNIPEDNLVLTDDTLSRKINKRLMEKINLDDNVGLAARKHTFRTDLSLSSLEKPVYGDLVQSSINHADKVETRASLSGKRAYMHDPFTIIAEQLEANSNTLTALTGGVQKFESVLMTKLNDLSEKQKANADTLDTLTGAVSSIKAEFKNMKSEFMTELDDLKAIGEVLKLNPDKLDDQSTILENILDKITHVDDQFQTISGTVNANSEKLDHLANYVEYVEYQALYSSCRGYHDAGYTKSGKYRINIPNTKVVLTVYCDQETDAGGWLVFQRREDGSLDFYRDWNDYKAGFGDVSGEFWLGNEHLHSLTRDQQELRVELVDFDGNTAYAKYESFSVGSESDNYKLSVSGFTGTSGDSLRFHNDQQFSTKDRDNDAVRGFCAQVYKSGWWYRYCHQANLNGIYYHTANSSSNSIWWSGWKQESLKKTEMKIRPKQ